MRRAYADNLKVLMVAAVVVAHVTFAWTGVGTWVLEEPPLREPLLSLVTLVAVVGGLFGLALFFVLAGQFTPGSLAHKGFRRFAADRAVRLGVPLLFFVVFLAPVVEYVDPDNADWEGGFPAFAVHEWWHPAPGPTWFLGVLLVLSLGYGGWRTRVRPDPAAPPRAGAGPGAAVLRTLHPLEARHLLLAATAIAVPSYLLRIWVPLGEERWHLALGQAPAWVVAFALGVLGAERRCLEPLPARTLQAARTMALAALSGVVAMFLVVAVAGADTEPLGGGGTWQSLVIVVLEGPFVVGMSLWLLGIFQHRYDRQGRLGRELGRAAYLAFLIHQVVLVGLVLATRQVSWPPEVDFVAVAVSGVVLTFGLASLLLRVPGVSRVV